MKIKKIFASILAFAIMLTSTSLTIAENAATNQVGEVPPLPEAIVTETGKNITVLAEDGLGGDVQETPVTFTMNFTAVDPSDAQKLYYDKWYADFELVINKDVRGVDGYLVGQYDLYGVNWVKLSYDTEDVIINANTPVKIMQSIMEMDITYEFVCDYVKNFDCGIYLTPDFLEANPDLEVKLSLNIYNEDKSIKHTIGDVYEFTASDANDFVASYNGVKYKTLQEAIDAVPDDYTGNGTKMCWIDLLCDAEGPGAVIKKETVQVGIRLNGYTYSFNEGVGSTGTESNGFQILNGSKFVLIQNGTLKVADDAASKFGMLIQNYANLTINGVTLDGRNLDRSDKASYVVSNNSGNVNINGNTVIIANDSGENPVAFDAWDDPYYEGAPNVTVADTVTINGKIEAAAKINTTYYATLVSAIEAAQENDEIKLLTDITLAESLVIPGDKTITLNLDGHTISGVSNASESYALINNNGNLTVTGNGKISYKYEGVSGGFSWGSYTIANRGVLTVENGTIENITEAISAHMFSAIDNYTGATATINGGTISCPNYVGIRLFATSETVDNTVILNDGTVNGKFALWPQNTQENKECTATLNINGGVVNGSSKALYISSNEPFTAINVTKDASVEVSAPEGYVWNNDGKLIIAPEITAVAKIGETGYETFESAIAAAVADASITRIDIIADINETVSNMGETYALMAGQNLTIGAPEGENYTVTINRPEKETLNIYLMNGNSSLTIEENLTIEGLDVVANGFATSGDNMTINGDIKALSLKQWTNNGKITISETGSVVLGYGDGQFDLAYGNGSVDIIGTGDKSVAQFKAGYSGTRGNGNTLNVKDTYFEAGAWFTVAGSNGTINADNALIKVSGGDASGSMEISNSGNAINLTNGSELAVANLKLNSGNTLKLGSDSKITATKIEGEGNIVIDATGLTAGEVTFITGNVSDTITVEVENNNLEAVVENGKIILVTVEEEKAIKVTYADGSEEYFDDILEAVPYTTNYPKLEGATVTLNKDIEGAGIRMMENDMVLDLNGHTYTIIAGTGSQGTNTSGFQLRPEVTTQVTIKNGTINVAQGAPVVYMFNNYAANLVLEDVSVDCSNMPYDEYNTSCYVIVSRINDSSAEHVGVTIKGNTEFTNFNTVVAGSSTSIGAGSSVTDEAGALDDYTVTLASLGATFKTKNPTAAVQSSVENTIVEYVNEEYKLAEKTPETPEEPDPEATLGTIVQVLKKMNKIAIAGQSEPYKRIRVFAGMDDRTKYSSAGFKYTAICGDMKYEGTIAVPSVYQSVTVKVGKEDIVLTGKDFGPNNNWVYDTSICFGPEWEPSETTVKITPYAVTVADGETLYGETKTYDGSDIF